MKWLLGNKGFCLKLKAPQAMATSIMLKLSSPQISENIQGSSCKSLPGSMELFTTLQILEKTSLPNLLFKKSPISIGRIGELGHCFNKLSEKLKKLLLLFVKAPPLAGFLMLSLMLSALAIKSL